MKTKLFISSILFSIVLFSCNREEASKDEKIDYLIADSNEPVSQKTTDNEKQQIPVGKFSPPAADSTVAPVQTTASTHVDWDSKIIKNATLKVEIKDFKKYNSYVHNAVKQYGAYVAQEEQTLSEEKSETSITIKVPVAQFETMMNALPADDGKVMEKKITTDDVTGQVVDTRSRLEAKKQMRLKYLEFLKQSKNMAEVLQVQGEIDGIQEQIESAASRVSYLTQQTAFSTINLTFYQPLEGFKPTGDEAPSFLDRIGASFKKGAGWIGDLLVGLMSVWPLLLISIGLIMGWKIVKRKKIVVHNP